MLSKRPPWPAWEPVTDDFREPGGSRYRVHLCFGPNCSERGSKQLWPRLEAAISEAGLSSEVELLATTCRNRCDYGPSLNVYPGPVFYNGITAEAVNEIVHEHLGQGRVCQRWVFRPKLSRS